MKTLCVCLYLYRSRKRRTSYTQDEREYLLDGDDMDECNAALVLMSLSCSPNSPRQGKWFELLNMTVEKNQKIVNLKCSCGVQAYFLSCTFWVTQTDTKNKLLNYRNRMSIVLSADNWKKKPWTLTMTVKWHFSYWRNRESSAFIFSHIFSMGKCYFWWWRAIVQRLSISSIKRRWQC